MLELTPERRFDPTSPLPTIITPRTTPNGQQNAIQRADETLTRSNKRLDKSPGKYHKPAKHDFTETMTRQRIADPDLPTEISQKRSVSHMHRNHPRLYLVQGHEMCRKTGHDTLDINRSFPMSNRISGSVNGQVMSGLLFCSLLFRNAKLRQT